jgi:HEAT repeat protein
VTPFQLVARQPIRHLTRWIPLMLLATGISCSATVISRPQVEESAPSAAEGTADSNAAPKDASAAQSAGESPGERSAETTPPADGDAAAAAPTQTPKRDPTREKIASYWVEKLAGETNVGELLTITKTIASLGPDAAAAVPGLAALLGHENRYLVTSALRALRKIGPEAEPALPEVIKGLTHSYGTVRHNATLIVRSFGRSSLPVLLEALRLDGIAFPLPALAHNLRRSDLEARVLSALALEFMGREAVPSLVALLDEQAPGTKTIRLAVRQIAISILGKIGPEAADAVPELVKLLETRAAYGEGATVIATLGKIGRAAVPPLTEVLHERRHGETPRVLALQAFSQMDPDDGVPALLEALDHEEEWLGLAAFKTLAENPDPRRAAVVKALAEGLTRDDKAYQDAAAAAFRLMGSAAFPRLVDALGAESWRVRAGAARALGGLGPRASAALPALSAALDDQSLDVRLLAIEGLAKIAPEDKKVLEQVTRLLDDKDAEVQKAARKTLDRIANTGKKE